MLAHIRGTNEASECQSQLQIGVHDKPAQSLDLWY